MLDRNTFWAYRANGYSFLTSKSLAEFPDNDRNIAPMALEDPQRTVGLIRFHAAEYHIDPHKIGVLGFSAGGRLSALTCIRFLVMRSSTIADPMALCSE